MFVRVAETGSFSRAGREMGFAQPTVSRMIGALEARLGIKLLMRTTRRVTPTDAGLALLERGRVALSELDDAESSARGAGGLSGVLRVATPVTFGAREITPGLGAFLDAHPALRVELMMADRRVDLLDEGVELAIRLGPLDDSSFISTRLASAPRFLVASPSYLNRHGAPKAPTDLCEHHIISGRAPGSEVWSLRDAGGGETAIRLTARLVATSTEGVLAAAIGGLGIARTSAFACRDELRRGDLVQILGQYALPGIDVHAVMPSGRTPTARVRAFIDHLRTGLARDRSE